MWKFCNMHNVPSSNLWFLRLPTRLVRSLTRYSPATNGCGCSQWFHNMFPWNSESMSPRITALEVSAFCDLIIAKSSRIGRGGTMGLWWILALGELVLSSTLLTPLWRVQSSPRFGLEKNLTEWEESLADVRRARKLEAEKYLRASGIDYTIVRPRIPKLHSGWQRRVRANGES